MKKYLLILFLICCAKIYAQESNRVEIKGKIVVESNDIEGITVFNASSNKGTTTNEKGEFVLSANLNDKIEFSALQFTDFEVIVDETIIETRQMTVYLVEQINKLDEVLILPYNLTGNLKTDIASVRTFNPNMDAIYFGVKNSSEYEFADDNRSAVENEVMHSQAEPPFRYGLNVINVAKLIISPLLNPQKANVEIEEGGIKNYYSIAFMSTNFDIPRDQVDAFVAYAEANGLSEELMKEGQELELLQFLYTKRDEYLAAHEKKN